MVVTIGMPVRSISSLTSPSARALNTPPPAQRSGRFARTDGFDDTLKLKLVALEARLIAADIYSFRIGKFNSLLLNVYGDVDEHRTGTARRSDVERLFDNAWDIVDVLDQIAVLDKGRNGARNVNFLKNIPAEQNARHLSGNRDKRNAVQISRSDSGD
jgi:hypothetical protein